MQSPGNKALFYSGRKRPSSTAMGSEKPLLGYWNIRGLGQPIRLLLVYNGIDFDEKRYDLPEEWAEKKFTLGLDFPNLPYYIEGSTKLTQSAAILKFLARKHGMRPKTEEERTRADMAYEQLFDLGFGLAMLCYGENYEKDRPAFVQGLPAKLSQFAAFLGENKWVGGGDSPTFADFVAYETFRTHKVFDGKSMAECKVLTAYLDRFEALPRIAEYIKSDRCISSPIYSAMAKWQG